MSIGTELLSHFRRIVQMGGGEIRLLSEDGDTVTIGFIPGDAAPCDSGACVLPHVEAEAMMREWLARRAPARSVTVELLAG